MTSESGSSQERRWLVEPPGSEDVNFQIAAGDQVQVTPEVQQALERLVQTLRGDDVAGYTYDPNCPRRTLDCTNNGKCKVEYQHPNCFIDYSCRIGSVP